jgi:hypothetical protein
MCGDKMWFNGLKYTKINVFFMKFHTIAKCFDKREYFITNFLFFLIVKRVDLLDYVTRFFFFGYYR